MSLRVVPTPYGRAAAEALRAEVARAKAGSPLTPVTVVVPGNSVGVATRRLLASGDLGSVSDAGRGVIGVSFLTAYRLAELLAAPRLAAAGRRPVSTPVVAAAVRRVLADAPGRLFAAVAEHPATEEALVGAHRDLSDLDDPALDLLAQQSARAREVVRIHRQVKQLLAPAWHDEHDLMRAATDIVGEGSTLVAELGTVVCHLPQRLSEPIARLLRALGVHRELVIVAGLTGVPNADAEVLAGIARLGGEVDADAAHIRPPTGTAVWSMSDADDEVRVVVRGIVDAMRDGVPLERMAVVVGNTEPYARLLHDHLDLAGIAHNGVSVRTLAHSVLGRSLLRLLALPDHDFRRDDVFALLAGAPVLDGQGNAVPAAAWERTSRIAGVVEGVAEWKARLGHYAATLEGGDESGRRRWEQAQARALSQFVAALAEDLERAPGTWAELARWAKGLVDRWIGNETVRAQWQSPFEQEAARRVDAAVERLGNLDAVEEAPTLEVFRRSLALELDAARDRVGRLGEGVLVGSATLALGVELDCVWVCGLAEGVFPAPPRDDPLLSDTDRRALGGALPLRADRIANDQRALLAPLAGTSGARTLCFPRGDLRRNTEHVPSRFLLDTIEVLAGVRELPDDPESVDWYTLVPSFLHGLTHAPFPATRHELDVRAALAHEPRIGEVTAVKRGTDLTRSRRSAAFTRFDGNLSQLGAALAAKSPSAPNARVSATRLETWVKCPHAYFVRYLLHAQPIDRPEELIQLSPLEKGNIVHETLDAFLTELRDVPGVGRPWSAEHRARMHELLVAACDDIEARGLGGRRLLWARARRELHAQLDVFLDCDAEYRAEAGADTIATELAFGRPDSVYPAIEIPYADGRSVRIIGSIDRVDRHADGRLAVIDYKSGRSNAYGGVSHEDPLLAGRLLQLPIYAHAARAYLAPEQPEPVHASYWFVLREPKKRKGYTVDVEVEQVLDDALRVVVGGIDAGLFPPRPPEPGFQLFTECDYCDPDALGTTDTYRAWTRKRFAPELADYLTLTREEGMSQIADAAEREEVRTRLDETLFVEAGAGTGKTTVLVARIVELVTADGPDLPVPMRSVAAITFTEKAAAELRDRVRAKLEEESRDESLTAERRARCDDALASLDDAAICTLHAFAQRILTAFPIEAGLPPRIEVHDEVSSLLSFEERWRRTRDDLLDDPELEPALLVLLGAEARLDHIRRVAEFLDDNWDLLDRIDDPPPLPPVDLAAWLADLDAVCAQADDCRNVDDNLLARLAEFEEHGERLRAAVDDAARIELLLAEKPSYKVKRTGNSNNWTDVEDPRARIIRLGEQRDELIKEVTDAALRGIAKFLAERTARDAEERRRAGELEFHDLLVLCRSLLRDPASGTQVRRQLRERYQRLLIDEFQDTDPIQVEIAALLAAPDDATAGHDWRRAAVTPGRLFFVGDPKQSIYRFRRADISTFLEAREHFAADPLQLSVNFRSTGPVLAWINHVFGRLIQPVAGAQPAYFPLAPQRRAAPVGPGVMVLGVEPLPSSPSADEMREREAVSVAAAVRGAIDERWQVGDGNGGWRDARLGDVCILLPTRTSLYFLERALDDAGVPYRAETSSLVYGTREVRDLLMTLRAVDDPSDELALVSALRSSIFGCGDDDLFVFHAQHGGRWDLRQAPPDTLPDDHPVADALRFLARLHETRTWVTPSELLEQVVREQHVLEVGVDSGRFRDVARRVRFVIDQAAAFGDAAGGSLRDYLVWATLQGTEGARVVETVLPETDDDAVRIMTIHGAKGLEFPIVVCSGMSTRAGARAGAVQVLFPPDEPYQVKLSRRAQTDAFELHKAIDEQMGFAEKLRLLYVACTRAQDHLVVSVHRADRKLPEDETRFTAAELLWHGARDANAVVEQPGPTRLALPAGAATPAVIDLDAWLAEHDQAFATGARRRFVSATALARLADDTAVDDPGVAKEGRDLELPPWNKGRYGTAIGRAVHAVLQTVDLASGAGLADLAVAQAAAEGVVGFEATIAGLVQAALGSTAVRAACATEYWRETYVAVPVDDVTLEGYVDLVYRDADGELVVVDYKTDAIESDGQLATRLAHYSVQAAAYAIAVAAATGEPVRRCVFVFLAPSGVREVAVEGAGLTAAIAQVHALVRSFRDDPPAFEPAVLADNA